MTLFVMLSRQRSGTGALAAVLEKHPDIVYRGEILDPTGVDCFFKWTRQREARCETSFDFCALFEEYIESLASGAELNFIDIKYNSLTAFAPSFYSVAAVPWILQHLSMMPVPILHLRRKNLLDAYVSGKIAEANRVWHHTQNEQSVIAVKSLDVDIEDFADFFRLARLENRLFERFFNDYKFSRTLDYEDCFTLDGRVTTSSLRVISELLSLDLTALDANPGILKQSPRALGDKITNLEQVLTFLASDAAAVL